MNVDREVLLRGDRDLLSEPFYSAIAHVFYRLSHRRTGLFAFPMVPRICALAEAGSGEWTSRGENST